MCGRCDREDRLLLCDGCDAGYHCECLDPPLEHIPIEEWYCPECIAQNRHQGKKVVLFEKDNRGVFVVVTNNCFG